MKFVAIIHRRLREGKTYDDYRKAWFHTKGFGVPTDMYSVIDVFDPRTIISIGIIDAELEQLPSILATDVDERSKNPLDAVIEETIIRHFGLVIARDDFSAPGTLTYSPAAVDGTITNFTEIAQSIATATVELQKASRERDVRKQKKGHRE